MAGCRRLDVGPTPLPTLSPTPRSTALPALPTSVPLGSTENPLQMYITESNVVSMDADVTNLQAALTDLTGLTINVLLTERPADALAALCASAESTVSIAWLDGLTALAAEAQGCGTMTLVLERNSDQGAQAARTFQIITRRRVGDFAALTDGSMCRISASDFETWLYPSILLKANGVDVARSIDEINEFETVGEMAAAVADGACDGAGISAQSLAELDEAVRDDLNVLTPSLDVAYGALLYPQQVSLNLRTAIDNAMTSIIGDVEQVAVVMADSVRAIERDDMDSLRDALRDANLDLAQIGR